MNSHITSYLEDTVSIIQNLEIIAINQAIELLKKVKKESGRLFFIGVGGSAANCSHAVNDFRKIAGIESYTPMDNIAELTARINDDGWNTSVENWLRTSRINTKDCLVVFSVGGGDEKNSVSTNLIQAMRYCSQIKTPIMAIVGKDGGFAAEVATALIKIPAKKSESIPAQTESLQAVIWHMLATHPSIRQ